MFFSQRTTPSLPDVSEAKLHLSRPASPVDSIISVALSITPPVAPPQATKSGIFGIWPKKSSPTPSVMSTVTTSSTVATVTSDLLSKHAALQDQFDELKEVCDLNRSTLQRLADELASKDQECMDLRNSIGMLNAKLGQSAETTQHSVKTKDDQLFALQIELDSIQISHDHLVLERDQLSHDLTTSNGQVASLQHENDALAARAAAAEAEVSKYDSYIDVFKRQYQTLHTLSAQEEQRHKERVDGMHAQQSEAEQRFQAQLEAKDTATVSSGDEVAHLRDQLRQVTTDRDDEARQANEWKEFANQQRILADALGTEVAELKGQGTAM